MFGSVANSKMRIEANLAVMDMKTRDVVYASAGLPTVCARSLWAARMVSKGKESSLTQNDVSLGKSCYLTAQVSAMRVGGSVSAESMIDAMIKSDRSVSRDVKRLDRDFSRVKQFPSVSDLNKRAKMSERAPISTGTIRQDNLGQLRMELS